MNSKVEELKVLINSGISIESASESLGLEVEAAIAFLSGDLQSKEAKTAEDFIANNKLAMAKVLFQIAIDPTGENIAARVSAARAFIDAGNEKGEIQLDKISEHYKKIKELQAKQRSESVNMPSPATNVVNITVEDVKLVDNKSLVAQN